MNGKIPKSVEAGQVHDSSLNYSTLHKSIIKVLERNPCFKISKSLSKLSSLLRLPHRLSVVRLKLRFLLLFSKRVPVQSSCDYFLLLLMCLKVNIKERIMSKILLGILNILFSWNPRYRYSFYFIEYRRLNIKIGKDC